MKKGKGLYIGIVLAAVVAIMAIVGSFYTPFNPEKVDASKRLLSPSLKYLFGTDRLGRDVFSRCLVGVRTTMLISLCVVAIGAVFGIIIGAVTGYFGGIADEILMRINDGLASFPSVLLALVFVSLFKSSTGSVVLVLGILFIPSFARVVRGEYKKEREKDYVKSIKLYGAGPFRIMFLHILPNTRQSLFSAIAIGINNAILAEAGLSYLGLGVQPPTPSLGRMLSEGQTYIMKASWNCIFPGLIILLAVLGFSLISDGLDKSSGIGDLSRKTIKNWMFLGNVKADEPETEKNNVKADSFEKSVNDIVLNNENAESEIKNNNAENDVTVDNKDVLLDVNNLSIAVNNAGSLREIVHNISFEVYKGEILGIVGESGSGKSMSAAAIMGLLGNRGVAKLDCELNGRKISNLSDKEMNALRGMTMTQVFQEPMTSLNPSKKIGWQLEQVIKNHKIEEADKSNKDIVIEAMTEAGITETERIYNSYPHEISGGQRQRALIAMAIIAKPKLLICDEPTTALDADVAEKILCNIEALHEKHGMSVIFISHDIAVIKRICDRVLVMKDGEIVEQGELSTVLENPVSEYTKALINAAKGRKYISEKNFEKAENVIEVRNLNVTYTKKHFGKKSEKLHVIKDMSFDVKKGETLGIVGESGSGKTTVLRAITGMIKYTGTVSVKGCKTMVFQDPYSSLNMSMSIERLLDEVLILDIDKHDKAERNRLIKETIVNVGLSEEFLKRKPSELSGGQRQRVAIAMAIITNPDIVLLDEPVTALDVTIQEKILLLLTELKEKYGLTYVMISHDKNLIDNMCDRCIEL